MSDRESKVLPSCEERHANGGRRRRGGGGAVPEGEDDEGGRGQKAHHCA